jgi:hypothetical protein
MTGSGTSGRHRVCQLDTHFSITQLNLHHYLQEYEL